MQGQRGLTLLELLVVLAIIAVTTAGVALAMRDSGQNHSEKEAQRLIAHLETARAQSRAQSLPLVWRATESGFVIESPAPGANFVAQRVEWLSADTSAEKTSILLGPEPIIAPATITLTHSSGQSSRAQSISLRIGTNGLSPFYRLP
jgi:general secretion pathway protein H